VIWMTIPVQSAVQTAASGRAPGHRQTLCDLQRHGNSSDTCMSDSVVVRPLGTDAEGHLLPIYVSPYHATYIRLRHLMSHSTQK